MQAGKLWMLHLLPLLIICNGEVTPRKLVCVIGAGRAGLAAVKLLADKPDIFDVIAFERNSDVGGLWIYRDSLYLDEHRLPAHSGIYKNLMTNIQKRSMTYPDYPDIHSESNENFISHEIFLDYMRNYTNNYWLWEFIQFDTLVTKVIPVHGNDDKRTTTWHLELQYLEMEGKGSVDCDAVIICNGRHSKPYKPRIPGLYETFPGPILHSRSYRIPQDFPSSTVVVLGAGASGIDIATDLSGYAKKIYLSHRHKEDPFINRKRPSNVEVVSGVVSAQGNRLTLQDNSTIEAEVFIFCTGYSIDFPFLDERSGVVVVNNTVPILFRRALNMHFPSMVVIGLPTDSNYGKLYYEQVKWFLNALQGKPSNIKYEDEGWRG